MKKVVVLLLVLMLTVAMVACGSGNSSGGSESSDEPIKIGFIGPLTGDSQPWGEAQLNEIKLCVDNVNSNGGILGRQVELVYYDNRADNVESANATKRLIQQDGVCAVLGPNASGAALSMASVCDDNKVPMIATNATNPSVTKNDSGETRPYVFRICMNDVQYGNVIATYAYNEVGVRTGAILFETGSDLAMGVKNEFTKSFEALGGEIIDVEGYKTDDVDFRAQLSAIKEYNPDAILHPGLYKYLGLAGNQAADLGITSRWLGTDTWFNSDILTVAGANLEGAVLTAAIDTSSASLEDIKAEYLEAYGEEIDIMGTTGYYGYDAFYALKAAIEKAGSDDPAAIRDALEGLSIEGCVGNVTIDAETHDTTRVVAIMEIKNSAFELLTPYDPSQQ